MLTDRRRTVLSSSQSTKGSAAVQRTSIAGAPDDDVKHNFSNVVVADGPSARPMKAPAASAGASSRGRKGGTLSPRGKGAGPGRPKGSRGGRQTGGSNLRTHSDMEDKSARLRSRKDSSSLDASFDRNRGAEALMQVAYEAARLQSGVYGSDDDDDDGADANRSGQQ
eukprot:scaffold503805_cov43-Prasinocladus_malaysianus.AAC.1